MNVKGKILSLLCLLSISFSASAVVVVCPDAKFFNDNPEFREGRALNLISGIGPVRVVYQFTRKGSLFGPWRFTQVMGGELVCYYDATVIDRPGYSSIAVISTSQLWKQGKNGPPWNGGFCNGDRLLCYATNN